MSSNVSTFKKHFFMAGGNLSISSIYSNIKNINSKVDTNTDSSSFSASKKMFDLTKNIVWICKTCGHTHIGVNPPDSCPICGNNSSSYEIKS